MKKLPKTENSLVLRTDFSDDAAWESICAAIREPVGEFRAYVDCISDPEYEGLTVEQLVALAPKGADHTFVFIVDRETLTHPERPILVVDLYDEPGEKAVNARSTFIRLHAGIRSVQVVKVGRNVGC